MSKQKFDQNISSTDCALRTRNPIREIVDKIKVDRNKEDLISLSIGDPTVFGNLKAPKFVTDALIQNVNLGNYNGYPLAIGYPDAREAIAQAHSKPKTLENQYEVDIKLTKDDVVITSGCSGALEMAIKVLAQQGDNVLIPKQGFSLYKLICDHLGVEARFYDLKPEANQEADLNQMDNLIDSKTRSIIVNNPSNPCGAVYSRAHLKSILKLAESHKVPIICDEIYDDLVFNGQKFYPIASLTSEVPVLAVGGTAKKFMVPGQRLGQILIHDRHNRFNNVRLGLSRLATVILGANSLAQSILPNIFNHLNQNPQENYFKNLCQLLEHNSKICCDILDCAQLGLNVIKPQGAMYLMVEILFEKFDDIRTDVDFCQKLLDEQCVFVLPGSCFGVNRFFRIVFCPPKEILIEACNRILKFCTKHLKKDLSTNLRIESICELKEKD